MAGDAEARQVLWERAIGPTAQRLDISAEAAEAYCAETVHELSGDGFVESVAQRGVWFDVYGVYRDRLGWFVKIGETDDGLLIISHHEPERGALKTVSGRIIEVLEP